VLVTTRQQQQTLCLPSIASPGFRRTLLLLLLMELVHVSLVRASPSTKISILQNKTNCSLSSRNKGTSVSCDYLFLENPILFCSAGLRPPLPRPAGFSQGTTRGSFKGATDANTVQKRRERPAKAPVPPKQTQLCCSKPSLLNQARLDRRDPPLGFTQRRGACMDGM